MAMTDATATSQMHGRAGVLLDQTMAAARVVPIDLERFDYVIRAPARDDEASAA